jgi:hypothetical protein
MAVDSILGITKSNNNSTEAYLILNDAIDALAQSANRSLSINLASADYTLTATEFTRNKLFQTTGNAVSRTLTVPASVRIFAVRNGGSSTLNVTRGSTTLTVATTKTRFFYTDGTTNGLVLLDLT